MPEHIRHTLRAAIQCAPSANLARSLLATGKYGASSLNCGYSRPVLFGDQTERTALKWAVFASARSTWQQTTARQTLRTATQSNPAATLTRTLLPTGKYGTACFDAGRYRPLLSGTEDSPLGGYLYKTLVFWDVTPVPKFQAADHTDFLLETWKFGTFQADGHGAAEFLADIRQFGAFQAEGRTAVAFKAHLGGAFQCAGTTDVEFLVQLPGLPQGLLSASGVPPPSNRKGRNYVF